MTKKKFVVPHTYVIVFAFIVLAAIATWIVPGGEYHKVTTSVGGQDVVEQVYQTVERVPQSWQIFAALFQGFVNQAGIIIFILMIGGAFWVMNDSKALDVGIMSFLKSTRSLERFDLIRKIGIDNIVIVFIMLMFSIFGAVFGMSEETIAFIIIFVPLAISMGYDSIVGVSICFVAAGLGFAGAVLNPFTIGIAQGLSDVPLFSGIEYRIFAWLVINIVGITYVLRYAHKIKKNPTSSLVYEDDKVWRDRSGDEQEEIAFHTPRAAWGVYGIILLCLGVTSLQFPTSELHIGQSHINISIFPILTAVFAILGVISLRKSVHFFILNLLLFTILLLIIGVMGYDWYIEEIASLFFAMGISSGISMSHNANKITQLFIEGAKDIMSAALVVGLAGGIIVILQDGKIIDSLLHSLSGSMAGLGQFGSVSIMYLIQNVINVVIPSGSAKAALTMPIMAPFSDLIGLSRQAMIMAFQFGDGFTNMLTPTSGVLIGVLGVAKIPYEKWVKWMWPLMVILLLLGWLLLIPTVTMELNGF